MLSTTKKIFDHQITVQMEDNLLEKVKQVKYLGVILDEKLTWTNHINHSKNKLIKGSYILSKLCQPFNSKNGLLLYNPSPLKLLYNIMGRCCTNKYTATVSNSEENHAHNYFQPL